MTARRTTPPGGTEPDFGAILRDIEAEIRPRLPLGHVASYIPPLARVPGEKLGLALRTVDGALYTAGEATEPFSIQSISKLFTLTLAMTREGQALWNRVGREPSGTAFNSLVQLEYEHGIPRNPFINAGALLITDVVLEHCGDAKGAVRDLVRRLSGNDAIDFDEEVAAGEAAHGHRNRALAHFLKSFGNLRADPEAVLDAYFHDCALAMSCADLATAALFLANGGVVPATGERLTTASQAKYINSLMLTCGVYDAAGDFAFRVGLPGKSGVGGGIVATMPGEFAICVWSPGLNAAGNSRAGTLALERFTTATGISIF